MSAGLTLSDPTIAPEEDSLPSPAVDARLRELVDRYHDFVWRSLRRLGVTVGDIDDCAQRVFLTAARKLESVRPGSERSFLFQTALREASDARRLRQRRREETGGDEIVDPAPTGDDLLDLRRARQMMDVILDSLPMDLRAVFVLCDLDELTMAEAATVLEVRPGTVASRLRRARIVFREKAARLTSKPVRRGGSP
jgi:RNA polymerase sigma-70 factor (ECF subfamily)